MDGPPTSGKGIIFIVSALKHFDLSLRTEVGISRRWMERFQYIDLKISFFNCRIINKILCFGLNTRLITMAKSRGVYNKISGSW